MSSIITNKIVQGNLCDHPAVKAWQGFQPSTLMPQAVTILKEYKKHPWKKKSAVYRIHGVGPYESSIVAKRCRQLGAAHERMIYENVLPNIGISSLEFYGSIDEPDSGFSWLFLEYADGSQFFKQNVEHRIAVAQWLAKLHKATFVSRPAVDLPDRGLVHYFEQLELGHSRLVQILASSPFSAEDKEVLQSVVQYLEVLKSSWDQIVQYCSNIPRVFAHGDFVSKNIQVRNSDNKLIVVPYDWETSGWGLPSADLGATTEPDLESYWAVVRDVWPILSLEDIQHIAIVGRVFRSIVAIEWLCSGFYPGYPERVFWFVAAMSKYRERMRNALKVAPWNQ